MTAVPCTCPHAIPAHFLWTGCSDTDCDCGYKYRPGSSDEARRKAKEHVAAAVRRAKEEGGRS